MSLLLTEQKADFLNLTNAVFTRQLEADSSLKEELDERARQKMYMDVQYNVDFLYTAMYLDDDQILARYARWLYQLLSSLMTYCTRERLRDILVGHYETIRSCMKEAIAEDKQPKLHRLLDCAINATIDECTNNTQKSHRPGKYETETSRYLDLLLHSNTKGAIALINEFVREGIPLTSVCADIVTGAMRQVGDLWQRHMISVDTEHYCTSVTQMALSQLYPVIFGQEHKGKTVLVACVGSELHEMGARMVADLFEYDGWDSIYLGATVPLETIDAAIEENHPGLAALSVTMPQHLPVCKETARYLKEHYPGLKIAVGGNAFTGTDVWKKWDIDIYTQDARDLVRWADETL